VRHGDGILICGRHSTISIEHFVRKLALLLASSMEITFCSKLLGFGTGYIALKDRAKDIIISGGENISSIEIENVLFSHPLVLEAAVVAKPDEKWGETPCAFVTLRPGAKTSEREVRHTPRVSRDVIHACFQIYALLG
jgi:acyl-CoA synthetase (AMP-forming)/AMP-acid ligase II